MLMNIDAHKRDELENLMYSANESILMYRSHK